MANRFLFCEPLTGWREGPVSERRTRREGAIARRQLSDQHDPTAERSTVVRDPWNTPGPASCYETLAPDEARR